jgi:ATP phosphoribosyltransferase regulatory subunit
MIPEGMRDVLPPESGQLRAIETALCRRFEAYGYGEVRTPWLEYAETLETVEDDTLEAGSRLRDQQGHEFVQAGAELLGLRSAAADAECVMLLCDCLAALGLREYRVALGTVAFYTALVDSLGLDDDREKFLEALADRDYPLLESIAGNAGADEDALKVLWRTLELSGTRDGLSQVRKLASSDAMDDAIRHLVEVRQLVEDAGFEDAVTLDFGLYQDLTYYSGVIFEAYAPGVGLPIASGGRYDGLLERFEWDIPGVGFAIALDRLHEALEEVGAVPSAAPACIAFAGGLDEPARAMELRRAGWAVAALPDDAPAPPRPRLHRSGGSYVFEPADGETVSGSWRDVLRALGIA